MWLSIRNLAFTFGVAVVTALFTPSILSAQESEIKSRKGFSGNQLFEHEWKWVPLSVGNVNVPIVPFGEAVATRRGVLGDGLGPLHNAKSCAQCHVAGGASTVKHNVTMITVDPRSDAITYKADGGKHLFDVFPALVGPQGTLAFSSVVHDRSTRPGYEKIRNRLADYVPGGIDGEWFQPEQRTSAAIAKRPVVAGRHGTVDFYLSQRNPPALFGVGKIDAITELRINELAKRQFVKSKGRISGRFVGKFGWRGQVPSLSAFVSQACAGELGLSQGVDMSSQPSQRKAKRQRGAVENPVDSQDSKQGVAPFLTLSQAGDPADLQYANVGVDMTQSEVSKLTSFVASIPRPIEKPPSGHTPKEVRQGERLFNSIGCADCHAPDLRPVSGMFSDLLLHDMGPELQSPMPAPPGNMPAASTMFPPRFSVRGPEVSGSQQYYGSGSAFAPQPQPVAIPKPVKPQFPRGEVTEPDDFSWDALQREWRTPPLWGVADTGPYLHDGRAETLEDAILWHGGEAQWSRDDFAKRSRPEKDLVIAFLSSLRAPASSKEGNLRPHQASPVLNQP